MTDQTKEIESELYLKKRTQQLERWIMDKYPDETCEDCCRCNGHGCLMRRAPCQELLPNGK